jgi:hypothetical protein
MAGIDHSAQQVILHLIGRHVTASKLLGQYDNGFKPRTV